MAIHEFPVFVCTDHLHPIFLSFFPNRFNTRQHQQHPESPPGTCTPYSPGLAEENEEEGQGEGQGREEEMEGEVAGAQTAAAVAGTEKREGGQDGSGSGDSIPTLLQVLTPCPTKIGRNGSLPDTPHDAAAAAATVNAFTSGLLHCTVHPSMKAGSSHHHNHFSSNHHHSSSKQQQQPHSNHQHYQQQQRHEQGVHASTARQASLMRRASTANEAQVSGEWTCLQSS